MKKTTQKNIREYVRMGIAHDITNFDFETMDKFLMSHDIEKEMYSSGINGLNGALLRDTRSGERYAITARTLALQMAI